MDIRCPNCNTLYEFDEARLKGGSVNLKCSQCSHIFRVEAPQAKQEKPRKRWMVRNKASRDIVYFSEMTQLQKWIIDRSVSRSDEISKTGKTWKPLGSIRELASLFEVADNIQRLQPDAPAPPAAKARKPLYAPQPTPPPRADFFVPNAPGEPASEPPQEEPPPPPPEDADSPWGDSGEEVTSSGRWNITVSSASGDEQGPDPSLGLAAPPELSEPEGPLVSPSFESESPDEPAFKTGDFRSIGTLDDPLDLPPERRRSVALPAVLVILLIAAVGGGFYLHSTGALDNLLSAPSATTSQANADAEAPSASTTPQDDAQEPDAEQERAEAEPDASDEEDEDAAATAGDDGEDAGEGNEVAKKDDAEEDDAKADEEDKVANRANMKGDRAATGAGVSSFNGLMKQGYEHRRNGRPQEALLSFQKALQKQPSSAEAQTAIGWCYLGLSRTTLAIAAFKQALKVNSSYADAYVGLGHAYRASGQSGQALEAYRTYLKLSPQGPKANMARKLINRMEK